MYIQITKSDQAGEMSLDVFQKLLNQFKKVPIKIEERTTHSSLNELLTILQKRNLKVDFFKKGPITESFCDIIRYYMPICLKNVIIDVASLNKESIALLKAYDIAYSVEVQPNLLGTMHLKNLLSDEDYLDIYFLPTRKDAAEPNCLIGFENKLLVNKGGKYPPCMIPSSTFRKFTMMNKTNIGNNIVDRLYITVDLNWYLDAKYFVAEHKFSHTTKDLELICMSHYDEKLIKPMSEACYSCVSFVLGELSCNA